MPPRLTTLRRLSPSVVPGSIGSSFPKNLDGCYYRGHDVAPLHPTASSFPFLLSLFSTTTRLRYARSREPTYYEILNVPVTATAAEIKKQFYSLSLKTHPDRNRSDPKASERFASISSAYHVLGDSTKRARYDLDHGIGKTQNTHSSGVSGQHPMGSHSSAGSTTFAGSRPASGLSKRRTAFRGPPPSFYAHGGYGAAGRASNPDPGGTYTGTGTGTSTGAGTNNDGDATSFINNNRIWHFNAKGHYKTQTAEDVRRRQRLSRQMQREREFIENQTAYGSGSFILRFIIVSGILVATGALGTLLFRGSTTSTSSNPDRSAAQKGRGSRSKGD